MRDSAKVRRNGQVPFQEIQGQAVIVVPARRELHQLDEVGTFLWNALRESRALDDLIEAVCEEFDVERDRAEKDVRTFVRSLEEKGLLAAS